MSKEKPELPYNSKLQRPVGERLPMFMLRTFEIWSRKDWDWTGGTGVLMLALKRADVDFEWKQE